MSCPFPSPFCRVHILGSHELQSCAERECVVYWYSVHTQFSNLYTVSHFPHGNEHVISWLARLFFVSCTALELNHEPRHSLLSPSLSKSSAAQVVAAGFFHRTRLGSNVKSESGFIKIKNRNGPWMVALKPRGSRPMEARGTPPSERVHHLPCSVRITSLAACGSPPLERMDDPP
jgi:hypothetical protein